MWFISLSSFLLLETINADEVCERHVIRAIDSECCNLDVLDEPLKACVEKKWSEAHHEAARECEDNACAEWIGGGCGHLYANGYFPYPEEFQVWVAACEAE